MTNRISPKKLIGTHWTAKVPLNREKHFQIIGKSETFEEDGLIFIEAILTNRVKTIHWEELKDSSRWLRGLKH